MGSVEDADLSLKNYLDGIISSNDVVLFMKGNKEFPQCGFSSTVVDILQVLNVAFHSVDVLQNNELRSYIKQYSSWPTIPQLYIKGEFIGGCDIVRSLYDSGELSDMIKT